MMMTLEQALDQIDSLHVSCRDARTALVQEWEPELPPTSLIMSAYADAISESIGALSNSAKSGIFDAVERILKYGEDAAKDAVATGLLEGLQARASNGSFDFREVAPFLGESTRFFCQEWDRFTGTSTPGLH